MRIMERDVRTTDGSRGMVGKARENMNVQESFMPEEQRPLRAFTPESNRI